MTLINWNNPALHEEKDYFLLLIKSITVFIKKIQSGIMHKNIHQ
jgi:hypothetical protein